MYIRVFSPNTTIVNSNKKNILLKKKGNIEISTWHCLEESTVVLRPVRTMEIRKIPPADKPIEGKTVIINTHGGKSIVFQPLGEVNFLVLTEFGSIEKRNCLDLQVDDSLVLYDEQLEDFYIEDIKDYHVSDMVDQLIELTEEDVSDDEKEEPKNIGDYVVSTGKFPAIINDFFMS